MEKFGLAIQISDFPGKLLIENNTFEGKTANYSDDCIIRKSSVSTCQDIDPNLSWMNSSVYFFKQLGKPLSIPLPFARNSYQIHSLIAINQ